MKTKNFKFKSMALVLFALVLSSNVWGAVEYNKIAWGDIANGDTIIIVGVKNSTNYVMVQATPPTPTSVSVSQDKITTFTANTEFVAEVSGSTIKFRKAGTTNYLVGTNTNNGLKIAASGSNSNVFSLDNTVSSGPRMTFTYSNTQRWCGIYSTQDWRCYNSKDATNIIGTSTIFFKKKVSSSKTLSSIAVTTPPTKKNYTTCETLDLSGCVVTATYSDESTENVTSSCTFNPANGAALTKGVTSVAVSYSGKNTTITEISVTDGAKDTFVDNVQGTADQYGECNGYTIPSCGDKTKSTGCEGEHYKFIGWSDKRIQSGVEIEPAGLLKAGETHDADDTTYYAVWAKEDEE